MYVKSGMPVKSIQNTKTYTFANLHLNVFFVASLTADTSLEERSIVIHIKIRIAVRSDAFFIVIQRGSFKVIYRVNTVL